MADVRPTNAGLIEKNQRADKANLDDVHAKINWVKF